jgi:hypothetical protein
MSCALPTDQVGAVSAVPEASRLSAGKGSLPPASADSARIGSPERRLVPRTDEAWAEMMRGIPERIGRLPRWRARAARWWRARGRSTAVPNPVHLRDHPDDVAMVEPRRTIPRPELPTHHIPKRPRRAARWRARWWRARARVERWWRRLLARERQRYSSQLEDGARPKEHTR